MPLLPIINSENRNWGRYSHFIDSELDMKVYQVLKNKINMAPLDVETLIRYATDNFIGHE